jgi:predicted transcriptional regulator
MRVHQRIPFSHFVLVNFFMELFMTKTAKLIQCLEGGKELTAKQITGTFGFKNPARAVHYLREQGYCVYSNPKTLSTGERVVKYRLGKPSRAMVALATKMLGASAFTR